MDVSVLTALCVNHHNQLKNRHVLDGIWEKPYAFKLRL